MKVLDLQCAHGHVFEGWFASEEAFQSQRTGGLLACPVCGAAEVAKLPSAPRLNLGAPPVATGPAAAGEKADAAPAPAAPPAAAAALQAAWLKAVRRVIAQTEDVGERFAEEARRMHYGETAERGIRGQASAEETAALLDEGIAVLPLPLPAGLKGPLQ